MTVKTLGGPANAALYIWLNGLEQSAAHCVRLPRSGDESLDAKSAYEQLTKRLDAIGKDAKVLPALTEVQVHGLVTVATPDGELQGSELRVHLDRVDQPDTAYSSERLVGPDGHLATPALPAAVPAGHLAGDRHVTAPA